MVTFPFLEEAYPHPPPPHPTPTHTPLDHVDNAHPVTGTNHRYMQFDWFHQENCCQSMVPAV